MTNKEKQLLLIDLCARLPYNVVIRCTDNDTDYKCFLTTDILNELLHNIEYYNYKPYLRPLESMTNEERVERIRLLWELEGHINEDVTYKYQDWLIARHFDYRGLIPKGLALEAPEDMYKNK